MVKETNRSKSFFRLSVPMVEESIMVENLAARSRHGDRKRKLKAHILNYKEETKKVNWTYIHKACPQWHAFSNKVTSPKLFKHHHQLGPSVQIPKPMGEHSCLNHDFYSLITMSSWLYHNSSTFSPTPKVPVVFYSVTLLKNPVSSETQNNVLL